MCEATCVLNELERLKKDIGHFATSRVMAYACMGFESRLQLCIDQLKAAGEGEKWYDLNKKKESDGT